MQLVDGRDLGGVRVAQRERLTAGVFNVCGPPSTFGELIARLPCRHRQPRDVRPGCREQLLLEQGVEPFDELPLWLPDEPENRAFYSISNARARAPGSSCAPSPRRPATPGNGCAPVRAGELPEPVAGGFVARGLSRSARQHCSQLTIPPNV